MLAHITEFSPDQIVAIEDMIEAATEHVGGLPAADFTIQDPGRYVIDPFAGQALDDEMIRIRADTLEEHDEWRWREANPGPDVTLPPPDKWAAIRAGMPELSMEGREALVARRKEKDTAEVVEIEKAREAKARAALDEEIAEEKRTRKEAWKKREAAEQERRDAEQERRDALPTPSLRPMFDIVHDVGAELSWQADGLTPHGGIMLFAGGKSAGKSTLARTYALAVARGDEFLGREVEQGPVVVASLEDPLGVSSEHWHLLGLREDDPVFGWNGQLPEDPASWLDGVHRKVQPALILIDSFGRWTRGKASMNSYDEIIAITEDVLAFCRATQCVVAFTHHIRKGGGDDVSETVSGSMALIGLMDTTIHLLRNGDGTRSIQTTQRAGESMETTALVFDAGHLTLGGVVWKNKAKEAEAKVTLHIPGDGAWICNQEVLKKCGGNKQAIVRALQNLVKEGVLDVQGTGTKFAPKEFRLRTVGGFEI